MSAVKRQSNQFLHAKCVKHIYQRLHKRKLIIMSFDNIVIIVIDPYKTFNIPNHYLIVGFYACDKRTNMVSVDQPVRLRVRMNILAYP